MERWRATRVTEPIAHHGEGACWDERSGRLLCVDGFAGAVLEIEPDGRARRHAVPSRFAAALRPRASGGWIVALEHRLALADEAFADFELLPELIDDPGVRLNDGGCDPLGRFHIGSMGYQGEPGRGQLWRLDPDGRTTVVLEPVSISNGIVWSLDGGTVYYTDTPTGGIDAIALDADGEFGVRRRCIDIDDDAGLPDGLAIDAEGGLWTALWGGGAVRRYTPTGELTAEISIPVRNATSCAFGGPDGTTLYITTSADQVPAGAEPLAGAIWAAETGVRGAPVHPYRG